MQLGALPDDDAAGLAVLRAVPLEGPHLESGGRVLGGCRVGEPFHHAHPPIVMALVDKCGVVLPQVGALVLGHFRQAPVAPQLIVGPGGRRRHVDTVSEEVAITISGEQRDGEYREITHAVQSTYCGVKSACSSLRDID